MDKDILMATIGEIKNEISSIESDVSSIRAWMPSNTEMETKLDRIIELLEILVEKKD